jgi:hypothetical protein
MRTPHFLLAAGLLASMTVVRAQDVADTCGASSSYDFTVASDVLVFDRAEPAPRRIELRGGRLRIDGAAAKLNTEDGDRLVLFERELRALVPQVKRVATRGVDLAVEAVRVEAAALDPGADTQAELGRRLDAHAADLRRRIAASTSTRDWQGEAFERQVDELVADIMPLLATDLGQQAIDAAISGDLEAAASLRDRATGVATDLEPRLERRLQALQPEIRALCPSIRQLHELQRGVRDNRGRPLDLLDIDA